MFSHLKGDRWNVEMPFVLNLRSFAMGLDNGRAHNAVAAAAKEIFVVVTDCKGSLLHVVVASFRLSFLGEP